jgi:hypothetical protein
MNNVNIPQASHLPETKGNVNTVNFVMPLHYSGALLFGVWAAKMEGGRVEARMQNKYRQIHWAMKGLAAKGPVPWQLNEYRLAAENEMAIAG